MLFSVSVTGNFDTSKLEYKWTVSAGEISDGQGTLAILVATTKELAGQTLTATVEIKGLPQNCQNTFSESGEILSPRITDPLDTYGKMSWRDEQVRLQGLHIELENSPTAKAYLIFSITKDSEINLVSSRLKKILKFLKDNKISQDRIQMSIEKRYIYQTTIWIIYK